MCHSEQEEEESGELHSLQRFGPDLAPEREPRLELCCELISWQQPVKAGLFHRGEFSHRNGSSAESG